MGGGAGTEGGETAGEGGLCRGRWVYKATPDVIYNVFERKVSCHTRADNSKRRDSGNQILLCGSGGCAHRQSSPETGYNPWNTTIIQRHTPFQKKVQ